MKKNGTSSFLHRFGIDRFTKKKAGKDLYSLQSFSYCGRILSSIFICPDPLYKNGNCALFLPTSHMKMVAAGMKRPVAITNGDLHYAEEVTCAKGCPQYSDTSKKQYPPGRQILSWTRSVAVKLEL
jgi:hypothetical protein